MRPLDSSWIGLAGALQHQSNADHITTLTESVNFGAGATGADTHRAMRRPEHPTKRPLFYPTNMVPTATLQLVLAGHICALLKDALWVRKVTLLACPVSASIIRRRLISRRRRGLWLRLGVQLVEQLAHARQLGIYCARS